MVTMVGRERERVLADDFPAECRCHGTYRLNKDARREPHVPLSSDTPRE